MDSIEEGEELWARHEQYRNSVRGGVSDACTAIGFRGECRVLLVGFPAGAVQQGKARVEPAGGPYSPADFEAVPARVAELFAQDSEHNPLHAAIAANEGRRRSLLEELRPQAVAEELQRHPTNAGWTFFASRSATVGRFETHVVLGIEAGLLTQVPRLPPAQRRGGHAPPSLVHALMDEVLHRLWIGLRAPVHGDRITPMRVPTSDLVRGAAGRLVRTALAHVDGWRGAQPDALLNAISALPYEGRPGNGTLVLAARDDRAVEVVLRLGVPISLREKRTIRKLMEASVSGTALLVDDEGRVYGIGRVAPGQDASVLLVSFIGRGAWDLVHDGRTLLAVRDGEACLPAPALDIARLRDLIDRLLPDADVEGLVDLAHAAGRHNHGAMLVISSNAAGEAVRLSPQSIAIQPAPLSTDLLTQLTSMDGAVLVDPQGRCHAVGVILDGRAAGRGDPARGSRYNNPVRYLDNEPPAAIVIVYSSDGGVDILPELHPRADRRRVANAVRHYAQLVDARPLAFGQLFEAWDQVNELRFYMSQGQCYEVNAATDRLRIWCAEHGRPLLPMPNPKPDPAMDEIYWLP